MLWTEIGLAPPEAAAAPSDKTEGRGAALSALLYCKSHQPWRAAADLFRPVLFIGQSADGIFRPRETGRMGPGSSANSAVGKFRKAADANADEGQERRRHFYRTLQGPITARGASPISGALFRETDS